MPSIPFGYFSISLAEAAIIPRNFSKDLKDIYTPMPTLDTTKCRRLPVVYAGRIIQEI